MGSRRQVPLSIPQADPHACTIDTRIRVCGKVPLFAGLDTNDLAQVNRHCHARGFDAGEIIYREGEAATHIYVVATGAIKTTRLAVDGRESLIDLHIAGDFFGALPALGQSRHTDSATALTPSCLLGLGAREYDLIMQEIPQVAMTTLKAVAQQLTTSRTTIHMLAGAPLGQRLAAMLLGLADKVGKPWNGGTLLDVPLAREDMAAMAGAAPESLSRLLGQWSRAGLIETGRRWVAIHDFARLRQLRDGTTADT